jgi:hypothetical protein
MSHLQMTTSGLKNQNKQNQNFNTFQKVEWVQITFSNQSELKLEIAKVETKSDRKVEN